MMMQTVLAGLAKKIASPVARYETSKEFASILGLQKQNLEETIYIAACDIASSTPFSSDLIQLICEFRFTPPSPSPEHFLFGCDVSEVDYKRAMEQANLQSLQSENTTNFKTGLAWRFKCKFWGYGCAENRDVAQAVLSQMDVDGERWGAFDHYTVDNPDPLNDIAIHVCANNDRHTREEKEKFEYALARLTHSATVCNEATAQFYLGTLYAGGIGVEKDQKRAAVWLLQAGLQGHLLAQTGYAVTAEELRDINESQKLAIINLAARMGDRTALRLLGSTYLEGDGVVPIDQQKATVYLQNAAQKGDVAAEQLLQHIREIGSF